MEGVTVRIAGADRIEELTNLWLDLHHYQGALSPPIPEVPLREDGDTGLRVRALYLEWLEQPDSFAFVAEADGRTVGYIIGFVQEPSEIWDTGPIGHIDSFLVSPEARGQGVGRLLLEKAYDELISKGVRTVGLDVVSTNDGARRFYEREGFVPTVLHMYRALPRSERKG
jgi:ribosomal protein S18 acetylase RimI-like enzyme